MSTELIDVETEMLSELSTSQMELVLGEDRPKIDWSKPEFSYNAQRLWRDRPDVARAAIKLLAEPREVMPYRRIMKRLHMSYHLLRQLEISSATDIKAEKKNLGDLAYTATEAFFERAISEAIDPNSKISAKDAMIGAGIGSEKLLQFRGEATQKIEITHKLDPGEKIREAKAEILSAFESMKRVSAREVAVPELEEGPQAIGLTGPMGPMEDEP